MLSLLTIYRLSSLPWFLPQYMSSGHKEKATSEAPTRPSFWLHSSLVGIHTLECACHQWVPNRKNIKIKIKIIIWGGAAAVYLTHTAGFLVVWLFSMIVSYSCRRSSHPITTRINSSFVTLKDCTHTHFYMSSHVCFWVMHSHDACGFDFILSVLFMSWCFISFLKICRTHNLMDFLVFVV